MKVLSQTNIICMTVLYDTTHYDQPKAFSNACILGQYHRYNADVAS
jgi:hypothetical protein